MNSVIDARGLSCPQPVLMTLEIIRKEKNKEFIVLVDTETSKENVSRAVLSQGWKIIDIKEDNGVFNMRIGKESK